jgi:glutamine cyclotransferase
MDIKIRVTGYVRLSAALLLLFAASCGEEKAKEETPATPEQPVTPSISWELVKEYPHDPAAFTEGLQYADGHLYESTGEYGSSGLRMTELQTGRVTRQQKLDNGYFGEGITALGDKIYMLTYKEHIVFVFDRRTFKQLATFPLLTQEGWGMTSDGKNLAYSDGTDNIYFMEPASFKEVRRIQVMDEHGPVYNVNELEYIKGFIYANQWQADLILKIDPATGKVVGRVDMSNFRQRTGIAMPGGRGTPEVMNGIAYDSAGNRIFITGKYWPKVFEVKLDN